MFLQLELYQVAQAELRLEILLPQFLECKDYRNMPL